MHFQKLKHQIYCPEFATFQNLIKVDVYILFDAFPRKYEIMFQSYIDKYLHIFVYYYYYSNCMNNHFSDMDFQGFSWILKESRD